MKQRAAVFNTIGGWFQNVGSWISGQVTPSKLKADADAVQQACVKACGFLPTVETIAGIFASGFPEYLIATTLANAICGVITKQKSLEVAGVAISGLFVKDHPTGVKAMTYVAKGEIFHPKPSKASKS